MISPHLLKVKASYSSSMFQTRSEFGAKAKAKQLWDERPTLVLQPQTKSPTWCHMIWAEGPAMDDWTDGSQLVVIWWSEMTPDTDRVLAAIEWEKHATGFQLSEAEYESH